MRRSRLAAGVGVAVAVAGIGLGVVLTGPGGGTWQRDLGSTPDDSRSRGPADVRIVLDAVDFCRLVANRVDPAALATVVDGDHALAQDLFVGAASLALD